MLRSKYLIALLVVILALVVACAQGKPHQNSKLTTLEGRLLRLRQKTVGKNTSKFLKTPHLPTKRVVSKKKKTQQQELADSFASPGSVAASYAKAQVGKGYSQQARLGPNSFDCSGLVKMAWKHAGKTVPNTTSGYPGGLKAVSGALQPGDILWRSGHVGLYVGNNQVVNAENPRTGVRQRDLSYFKKYLGYTRVYRP